MPPAPRGTHGPVNLKALNKNVINRLMSYLRAYRFPLLVVLVCIVAAAISSVVGMTFLETIIDDYIKPLLLEADPVDPMKRLALETALYLYRYRRT